LTVLKGFDRFWDETYGVGGVPSLSCLTAGEKGHYTQRVESKRREEKRREEQKRTEEKRREEKRKEQKKKR
jgi:hypothetical protein